MLKVNQLQDYVDLTGDLFCWLMMLLVTAMNSLPAEQFGTISEKYQPWNLDPLADPDSQNG